VIPLAAVTRDDVADYVAVLVVVYTILIFVVILLSWIPRVPYNVWSDRILKWLQEVTGPYLNLFRRIIPPVRLGPGALHLSPIVAVIVLQIVGSIVVRLIRG
jgi:YggT family protein